MKFHCAIGWLISNTLISSYQTEKRYLAVKKVVALFNASDSVLLTPA